MKFSLALLFFISLSSCYRDTKTCRCAYENPVDFKNECRNVDEFISFSGTANVIAYKPVGLGKFRPSYNPLNANEIAYVLNPETPDNIKGHVVVANLETDEHRFVSWLDEGFETSKVRWSKNGMLYVSGRGIVNPNNGEYMAISKDFGISDIEWTANGDKLLGWVSHHNDETKRYWETNYPGYKMVSISWPELVVEPYDLFSDNDKMVPHTFSISPLNELTYYDFEKTALYTVNLESKKTEKFYNSDVKIGRVGGDYKWSADGNELYFANKYDGIFKIKKGKNKQYRIKKGCPNRQYHSLTLSPDGDKIIAERRDIEAERDGTYISETTRLVIMDIDGCNEKVLFEDWDGTVVGRP